MQTSNHLAELSKSNDLHLTKYDQLLFLADFNRQVAHSSVNRFFSNNNLTSTLQEP